MSLFLSQLIGVVILFPFIVIMILLVVSRRMGKAPVTVIGRAADVTTPFLFISVYIIFHTIFAIEIGFYLAMIALVIGIIYAMLEKRQVKEFQIKRMIRKLWRVYFLLLAVAYVVLLIVGVVLKIVEYVT